MSRADQSDGHVRERASGAPLVRVRERTAAGSSATIAEIEPDLFWADRQSAATRLAQLGRLLRLAELSHFPGDLRRLTIPAAGPDGFNVELTVGRERVVGCFGGLGQCFGDLDTALDWVARAVDGYALEIRSYAGVPKEWTLGPGDGAPGGPTIAAGYRVAFRRFRRSSIEIRRNVYRSAAAPDAAAPPTR